MDSPLELADIIDEETPAEEVATAGELAPAEEVTPDPAISVAFIAGKFAEFQIEREKKFIEFTSADTVGILGVEVPKSDDGNSETPEEMDVNTNSDDEDDNDYFSFEDILKEVWYACRG